MRETGSSVHQQQMLVSQRWPVEQASSTLPPSHTQARLLAAVPSEPSPHILLIDDSPTIRKIIETCHRRAGFAVKSFADGFTALCWLSHTHAPLPPLIYLDIEMPRIDGYEVARRLRGRPDFPQTALLMLSGRDSVTDRVKGLLVGARGYIAKPFRAQDMLAQTHFYLSSAPSLAASDQANSTASGRRNADVLGDQGEENANQRWKHHRSGEGEGTDAKRKGV